MKQIEVELKAKLNNPDEMKSRLKEMGAKFIDEKYQVDTYLSPPHKSLIGENVYLRIRHDKLSGKARFEYDIGLKESGASLAEEYEVEIDDPETMLTILNQLDFVVDAVVDKKRLTYKLGNFNIVLDDVKKLGRFMEIELLDTDYDEAEQKINELYKKLNVPKQDIFTCQQNYFDMLIQKKS
jgi:adenylate cyclase class 2